MKPNTLQLQQQQKTTPRHNLKCQHTAAKYFNGKAHFTYIYIYICKTKQKNDVHNSTANKTTFQV